MDDKKSEIIQICGLWQNETKDGASKFLKGNSGQVQYLVFRNKNKTAENQPDYHLCITKNNTQKKEIKSDPNNPWNSGQAESYQPENFNDYQEYNDDDTPF